MADEPEFSWSSGFLDKVKKTEGMRPRYWDYKQYSIGHGTKWQPGMPLQLTPEQANDELMREMTSARAAVAAKYPHLPPTVQESLASASFNFGTGWMNGSGLDAAAQTGDPRAIGERLMQYTKAGGVDQPGLVARRRWEVQHLMSPPGESSPVAYNQSSADPAPSIMPDGISAAEAAARQPVTNGAASVASNGSVSAPRGPTVTIGKKVAPSQYRAIVANALMQGKLSQNPTALEGISNAFNQGLGTYQMGKLASDTEAHQQQIADEVARAYPNDPAMAAFAQADPKLALQLGIANTRADAAARNAQDREDARSNTAQNREDARASATQKLEWLKHGLKQAGEVNDPKNWKTTIQGAREIQTNIVSGETRVYRGGVLESTTPGKAPVVPMPGMPGLPIGTEAGVPPVSGAPPSAAPPTPQPSAPAQAPAAKVLPAGMSGADDEPVATPAAVGGAGAPPPELYGMPLSQDGKTVKAFGGDYNRNFKDGTEAPELFFRAPYLRSQTQDEWKSEYGAAIDDNKAQRTSIDKSAAQARTNLALLDRADTAIKNGTDSGTFGSITKTAKTLASSLGIPVSGLTDDQVMQSISTQLVPLMRQGLPGSVSNFEMENYLKGVLSLGNTPEANFMLSHFMRRGSEAAEQDRGLAQDYLKKKAELKLPGHLDEGFREFADTYHKEHPIFGDQDRQLQELASKGVKVKDLMAFRETGKLPEPTAPTRAARRSLDGTLPPAGGEVGPPANAAVPPELDGAPQQIIDAYMAGKPVRDAGGRTFKRGQ